VDLAFSLSALALQRMHNHNGGEGHVPTTYSMSPIGKVALVWVWEPVAANRWASSGFGSAEEAEKGCCELMRLVEAEV
jgi:hypothetical protein